MAVDLVTALARKDDEARPALGLGSVATKDATEFATPADVDARLRIDAAQGLDSTQRAQGRSNLALGSMAEQAAGAVAVTGGNVLGLTTEGVGTSTPGIKPLAGSVTTFPFVKSEVVGRTLNEGTYTTLVGGYGGAVDLFLHQFSMNQDTRNGGVVTGYQLRAKALAGATSPVGIGWYPGYSTVFAGTNNALLDVIAANPTLFLAGNGTVGIGTAAPTANLDIVGTLKVSGSATIDTAFVSTVQLGGNTQVNASLHINGAAGSDRQVRFKTAGVDIWTLLADNAAQSGSNAGSDLVILRRSDAGAQLGTALKIMRATGLAIFEVRPSVSGAGLVETQNLKGVANGYAGLDTNGFVPTAQLPASGSYKGNWNASTNTPTIVAGTGTNGDEYTVSVAGTQSVTGTSTAFSVGDRLKFTTNGNKWERIPGIGSGITSVNGKTTSTVTLTQDDVGDGTTYKKYPATEQTKLAALPTAAGMNATYLRKLSSGEYSLADSATIRNDGNPADAAANGAEINTLLASIPAGAGGSLAIPPGAFYHNGLNDITDRHITIHGMGKLSNLISTHATKHGINVVQSSYAYLTRLEKFSTRKSADADGSGYGIRVQYPVANGDISKSIHISNIMIAGIDPAASQFAGGILMKDAWGGEIEHIHHRGKQGSRTSAAALFYDGKCVGQHVRDVSAFDCISAISSNGDVHEGWYFSEIHAVGTDYLLNVPFLSVVGQGPGIILSNSHGETFKAGVKIVNHNNIQLSNLLLYKWRASAENWTGVWLESTAGNGCDYHSLNGIIIHGMKGVETVSGTATGMLLADTKVVNAVGMTFNDLDVGVNKISGPRGGPSGAVSGLKTNVTTPMQGTGSLTTTLADAPL